MKYSTILLGLFMFVQLEQSMASIAQGADSQEFIPYVISRFDVHNQTWSISQSPFNRLIYLASSEGLMEFNGIDWARYPLADKMPCRSVLVDSAGIIYTGSFEDFGYWQHNASGILEYHSLSSKTEIEKNDEIWKIYWHNGKLFFQSFTAIYIYDGDTITKLTSDEPMLFLHQVGNRFIAQILERGLFWVEDEGFKYIENSHVFANIKVHAIIPYKEGKYLVCTDNCGVFLLDDTGFSYFDSQASSFLKDNICNAAKQVNDSTYAFGSILNGLIITNAQGEIISRFNTRNGLRNNTVLSIYKGIDNGLWIGLDDGVHYLNLSSAYAHYKTQNGEIGTIYALLKRDNKIYIGTNHGLFLADFESKGWLYHFGNIRLVDKSQGQVWALEEYDGQILCGHNEGTFTVQDETLQKISSITGGWSFDIHEDYLLGGTYTGIVSYKKNQNHQWEFYSKSDSFLEPLRYIEIDYLGYIWASHHQKGIYRIEMTDDLREISNATYFPEINHEKVNLKVSKINNRIVFTSSENIYTYDYVRNNFVVINPLSNDLGEYRGAFQICHHAKNDYWFFTENGIALFEIGIDFSAIKKHEIQLQNIRLPQHNIGLVNLDENTILVPTSQGFDTYNLSLLGAMREENKPIIEKVIFYGKDNRSSTHCNPTKNLTTRWNLNSITVHFIAPYLFDYPNKHYSYRIKELDSPWQSTVYGQFTFPGLKYGHYTIEIKDYLGNLSQLHFSIAKPWYYSGTAIVFYVLIFIIISWLLYKHVRYKINKAQEILAMEVRQSMLEKELDYKNYELILTIRHLINRNEILSKLQNEIETIKDHSSKYPVKNLRVMESIINEGLQSQTEDWKNALNKLKLSQQGFNKKLLERYSELTTNDLRLCSYLRMNFSTKEIARLINISPRAVEISRYRLRKKLNLDQDQNLNEFLINEDFLNR